MTGGNFSSGTAFGFWAWEACVDAVASMAGMFVDLPEKMPVNLYGPGVRFVNVDKISQRVLRSLL